MGRLKAEWGDENERSD
jgi:hypothetical protein